MDKRIKRILDDITGTRYVQTLNPKDLSNPKKAFLKNAYLFRYERPKTKNSLPYWDTRPIILILARQGKDRVLGINLNHVPYATALQLSRQLERKSKNKKRSLKYSDVKEAIIKARLPKVWFMVAIKSYLLNRIDGNVYPLEMGEYSEALKRVPRNFKKMGLGDAMRYNNAKVYAYIKKVKATKKK